MLDFKEPLVRVIAATQFFGVPPELVPEKGIPPFQDQGTDFERLVECAGRNCYDSYGRGRSSEEYHQHILDVCHGSVTEHAYLTFYIEGISRGLTHELVRHRVGVAYSQRSTRYVDESDSPWIHHPLIKRYLMDCDTVDAAVLEVAIEEAMGAGRAAYNLVVKKLEKWLKDEGCNAAAARKQARGAARGYLGNSLETAIVFTTNIRTLRNCIVEKRLQEAADGEIREMAALCLYEASKYCGAYTADYQLSECADGIGKHAITEHRGI